MLGVRVFFFGKIVIREGDFRASGRGIVRVVWGGSC